MERFREQPLVGRIAAAVLGGQLLHLGLPIGDLGVDLAGDEVLRAVGLEQLGDPRLAV